MLGKLLKYELKASSRTLIPLYIGILILSTICGVIFAAQAQNFMNSNKMDIFFTILYLLLFALLVAMGVLTIVCIIQRFYKNLLGDEGFLMFTLPVSSVMLLASKLVAAMIWTAATSIVGMLSFAFTMFVPMCLVGHVSWNDFLYIFQQAWQSLLNTPSLGAFILQLFLTTFLSILFTILLAYAAMMIGQLQIFSRHQIVISFIAFFLLGWAFSAIFSLLPSGNILSDFAAIESITDFSHALWIPIVGSLVQCVILFFGVNYLMQRQLNL